MSLKTTVDYTYIDGEQTDKRVVSKTTTTNSGFAKTTGTVGTTDATVDKGGLTAVGQFSIQNTGSAGDLLVGNDGTNYPVTLEPGDPPMIGRLTSGDIHVKGSAAGVEYQATVFESP